VSARLAAARKFSDSSKSLLSGAQFLEFDVLNKVDFGQLSTDATSILHTATANDIISRNPRDGMELSAMGTKNILDFAARNSIQHCVIFSTLQVYGSELKGDIDESSPLLFQNDYGINHLFAEMYGSLYSRLGKLGVVAVRPSNVYGPVLSSAFNRWSLVPGCFCKEAHESGSVTLRSSGKQIRNFVHLENLSRAVDCILQHFPDSFECYNLVSSQAYSMLAVAEKVKKIYEKLYNKPLHLDIQGSEPTTGNEFSIRLDKLKSIGFREGEEHNLESAIEQIFTYLRTN